MDWELIIKMILNSTLIGSIMAIIILGFRKILNYRIRINWICTLWFVLMIRLIVPYIPNSPLNLSYVSNSLDNLTPISKGAISVARINHFSPLIDSLPKDNNSQISILLFIWLSGVIIFVSYIIIMNVIFIKKAGYGRRITDERVYIILDECKRKISLNKNINLISVNFLRTPAVFGLFKPLLLIPDGILRRFDKTDLRNIILHELMHIKRKDMLINSIISLGQVFHWFNPVIWYALKTMHIDREMACDEQVLSYLEKEDKKSYGCTILGMMDMSAGPWLIPGLEALVESRKSSIERLKRIIAFKGIGRCPRMVLMFILLVSVSFVGVNAYDISAESILGPVKHIEETCYDQRVTVAQSFSPVTRVLPDADNVILTDIKSTRKLAGGIETLIIIEVEYCLASQDNARLCIMFNNGPLSNVFVHKGMVNISKGTGKYVFTIPVTPVSHISGRSFSIRCSLHTDAGSLFDYDRELIVEN